MSDSQPPPDPVVQLIEQLLSGPARPGQAFTMPGCNFDGLYRLARRLKAHFDRSTGDGAPVCLASDDRRLIAAALLATLAGGPRLLLPHALSAAALGDLQSMCGFQSAVAPPEAALPEGVVRIDPHELTEEAESLASEPPPDPDRPWVDLFTGGSTGSPRLWSKTPRNLLGEVDYLRNRYAVGSGDRILATVPALHIYGLLYSLLLPLVAAARVAAPTPSFPEEIKQQMTEVVPTILISVPVHYRALKANPPPSGALRLAFSSAGPLSEADGQAFSDATGVDLIEIYGSTETGGIATRCRAKGETGFTPYDCIQWRVTGDRLDIRSAFLSAELPVRPSGWFTTADRVKPHGDGAFVVVGRADTIVKVGGNRVDLEKIRQAITGMAEVDEALVVATSADGLREKEIVALVVGRRPPDEIQSALADCLEPHERPRRIRLVPSIPTASTGKIDRRAVDELTVDHRLTVEPAGLRVPLDETRTVQQLVADHHLAIRSDCGGLGICGKCRVLVHPTESFSPPTDAERDVLTPDQMNDGYRLACQTTAHGSGTVTLPENLAESADAFGKTDIAGRYPTDPATRRLTIAGRPPDLNADHVPTSLLDWLADQAGPPAAARADRDALQRLGWYRGDLKDFTLVVHEASGIRRVLPGHRPNGLGLAVDLGTTSVAGYLCDLATGRLLAAEACVNPQRRFGEDVISRISRINVADVHLAEMQGLAVKGIDQLLERCLARAGATRDAVDEVAVCGNTTMEQILAGLHPYGLGVFPYLPLTLTPPLTSADAIGLNTDPSVAVYLMPVISGFVGGDTMAAILAERPHDRDAVTLIVDIGTNGEVVLGNRDGLWATSCATGPALEGAQISCGMRAVTGAIHRAWPDDAGGRIAYAVLGDRPAERPLGICGSGIIDVVAALRRMGAILPNGRFDESHPVVAVDADGVGRSVTIADGGASATGDDITLTLKDIRQIQLAKGALLLGIERLMQEAGIQRIDRTVLTGAFGARFDWRSALAIGMLPPAVARGEVVAMDNLAGVGVVMALLDKTRRQEARELCRRIRCLELAATPDFATAFAAATAFPDIRA